MTGSRLRFLRRPGAIPGVRTAALLSLLASAAPATPPRGGLEPGFGVTPGGLVWTVEPAAHRLVLRDADGTPRAAFPLGDEGHVLGVADSGARVTSPAPDGLRRGPARAGEEHRVEARYVFRFPDGSVRATVTTSALRGSEPAFLGDAVWLLRREGDRWTVVRVAPEGETPVGSTSGAAIRKRVGRPSAPRLFAGPAGVAVLFPGTRGDAAVRLDHPDALVVPDPLDACGEGRVRLALPHPGGVLVVSLRTAPPAAGGEDLGEPLAVAEVLDDAGRAARSVALGPWNEVFPMPDGGLLALDGMQAARFDDRFAEVSRAVLPLEEGSDPAAAARVVEQLRRLDALGSRATGADWAELALLPGAPPSSHVDRARSDPTGALERLARVGDGESATARATKAVALLLDACSTEERTRLLASLRERAERGSPAWLRHAAAFALLAAAPKEAPAWALPAAAEAIASGAADADLALPDEAYTPELAELVTAVDRARIDRLLSASPDLAESILAGSFEEAFFPSEEGLRFHAPPARFPRTLLDCAAGPPSASGLLALSRVAEAAIETSVGQASPPSAPPEPARSATSASGRIAAALLEAQHATDPGLRASAEAIGPLARLPIDAARFRADVLPRPHLGAIAAAGLVTDRSLPPRAFMDLFQDLFSSARAASRDPFDCMFFVRNAPPRDGEQRRDRYCNILMIVQMADSAGEEAGEELLPSRERTALLAGFARSGAAPPELRLDLTARRALRGAASEDDVLALLGEREIAPIYRRIVLGKAAPGWTRLGAYLERELTASRVPPPERGAWLDALARTDPAAADRFAAEAWERGVVPLDGDDGEAGAFCRALAPERLRESETLRAALRRARDLPAASLEAATALARAGDAGSAGPLVTALLESCPACHTPADLAALFGPLGGEGLDALARLAEETLPFGTSPLEALFELEPARAEALGRSRLAAALERGCVPGPLLPALLAHDVDPFPDLLDAVERRGCDRTRLRPGEGVASGIARPAATDAGRAARRALDSASSPSCRAALASLLGIPASDPVPGSTGAR